MSGIHKGMDPQTGRMVSEGTLEKGEVAFRKEWDAANTTTAVRADADYIAAQTGADPDKVFASLVKRYKPHEDDSDSITRRDEGDEFSDDDLAALLGL
jgi:hypothetical protein